jgi:hypothetical protein
MQTKIKLLIYLALWKRPQITELCFKGLNRLRQHPDFDIQVLAVASEPGMLHLCEKYNVMCVTHSNEPLGKKKNFGLQAARGLQFDYLLEIGSDTLILNELLDQYVLSGFIGSEHFFGVADCAFIDSESQACRRTGKASTYGGGRMISRAALEAMEFKIWPDDRMKGLDNASVMKMAMGGFWYKQVKPAEIPMVVDVKSEVNIWPFNHLVGVEFDVNRILERLSEEEVSAIKELWAVHA